MGDLSWLGKPFEIGAVDLLLGADNALVIALACRNLAPASRGMAIVIGSAAAIVLRFVLTAGASYALAAPGLGLVGAALLLGIAIRLALPDPDRDAGREGLGVADAVVIIVLADLVMSLDNVLALAAIAQGQLLWLLIGLALSVPVVISGSVVLLWLTRRYPGLVLGGSVLLGWLAGQLAAGDAAIAGWIAVQAPALAVVLPVIGAVYVYGQTRIAEASPRRAAAGRPVAPARVAPPAKMPPVAAQLPRLPAPQPAPQPRPVVDMPAADVPETAERRWLVLVFGALFAVVGLVLGAVIYVSDQLGM